MYEGDFKLLSMILNLVRVILDTMNVIVDPIRVTPDTKCDCGSHESDPGH